MRAWFHRVGRHLIPSDEASEAVIARMAEGECAEFSVYRPRSVQWNRLYWRLCRTIGENQDPQRGEDSIDTELRVLAGHYEVMLVDGHEVRVPKRISFEKLTADEWAELWPSLEQAVADRFGDEYLTEVNVA